MHTSFSTHLLFCSVKHREQKFQKPQLNHSSNLIDRFLSQGLAMSKNFTNVHP